VRSWEGTLRVCVRTKMALYTVSQKKVPTIKLYVINFIKS